MPIQRCRFWPSGAAAVLATTGSIAASQVQQPPADRAPPAAVTSGTPVRLMVMKEVTTRYAKIGDRFRLRVDEAATIGGTAIPVGSTAWGEVTSVSGTNVGGKSGKLAARLLYIELPSGRLPLVGTSDASGDSNNAGVLLGMLVWGPLALLNHGDNGKLKAGQILIGYVGAVPPGSR